MQHIFWLDDEFDFLGDILRIGSKYGLTKQSLLEKVTFAFDYEMGADIISKKQFDVYILDADFFNRTTQQYKNNAREFLQNVTADMCVVDCFHAYPEGFDHCMVRMAPVYEDCNFVRFYNEHLKPLNVKTVIFSVSLYAPIVAYHLGLPFYAKGLTKEVLQEHVEDNMFDDIPLRYLKDSNIRKPSSFLQYWESGSREELIQRYLTVP